MTEQTLDQASASWQQPQGYSGADEHQSDGCVDAPPWLGHDALGWMEAVAVTVNVLEYFPRTVGVQPQGSDEGCAEDDAGAIDLRISH